MSRENVEVVRGAIEAFQVGDFEGLLGRMSRTIRQDYTIEPKRFIDAGDHVVVDAREVGVAENSGVRVEQSFSHAFRLQDDQIVEWRMFGPLEEALEAVGLRE